ncbi:MAG TPA: hypothetical protein VMQ81_05185 [Acidimicrobiia bacterium]|nr:hypothetical protein [Acidimicrobiia bacterium]
MNENADDAPHRGSDRAITASYAAVAILLLIGGVLGLLQAL